MDAEPHCQRCGVALTGQAVGELCANCLLKLALEAPYVARNHEGGGAVDSGHTTIVAPLTEVPGTLIGRYKLREELGEGGFGVVYVAEQEEPVRRRVALKVIKLGMDTKQVVARFEAERQALAMMDHPNIAKVLDAGTTDTGRPYFVMELVRGIRITDYCDQNNLSTRERLELFIKICQAIQHAHQKGIIHRDIKPSNILVTLHDGAPVPKVIDFGIAKATEGRLTNATVYTQLHQFIGTPAYMSPEQAEMSGLDIDTRTDIYSLGVLLYELLTGKTPFDGKELMASGIDAMRKTIREKEPPRPSTRLTQELVAAEVKRLSSKSEILDNPKSEIDGGSSRRLLQIKELVHLLRGDLDWIVMKCLEKDRTRRYETVNGLAADLKRHFNHEPVVARPPSAVYRFQKAYRRNRIPFTAAACVLGSLIITLAFTWVAARRESLARVHETIQRNLAEQARANAEAQTLLADGRLIAALGLVDSLMETNLPHLSALIGATEATESLIRSTVGMVEELNRDNIANPQVRLRLANLNRILGTIRGLVPGLSGLGDPEKAMKFTTEAMRLMEHPSVRELPRGSWLPTLLRVRLGMGLNLHTLGRFDDALKHFEAALDHARELANDSNFSSTVTAQHYMSSCRISIGRSLRDLGRHQEALEAYFLPAFEWARSLKLTEESPIFLLDEMRTICLNIGDAYAWLGPPRDALPYSEEGLRISEALVRRAPNNARTMALLSVAKSQVGKVLLALGDSDRAEPLLADSFEAAERLVAKEPADAGMRLILCYVLGSHALGYAAWSRDQTAAVSERRRRYELARSYFDRAGEQIAALPSESARILPRHGLKSTGTQIEAARAQIEATAQ